MHYSNGGEYVERTIGNNNRNHEYLGRNRPLNLQKYLKIWQALYLKIRVQ